MKKCPTCGKEFEDSMKFCQLDGTSLENVAEEAPFDPYATMVSMPSKPAETQLPELEVLPPLESDPIPASSPQDDVLDLGEPDPLKTMMVSSDEMQQAMANEQQSPAEEAPVMPTPDSYITPEVDEPSTPSYGEPAPPPSPFSTPESPEPAHPAWDEAATMMQPPVNVPFDPPAPVQEWAPPPVPDASWQGQQIGSNTPFQPPPAGVGGQNKTLPIVSLVLGILSICCYVSPVTGIAAIICGFLALKNIKSDPNTYGGKGLAIAGMICGAIFLVIGVLYYILLILGFASGALNQF
jgi:hypothetical protein